MPVSSTFSLDVLCGSVNALSETASVSEAEGSETETEGTLIILRL
jgi:hypothetical protein